MTSGFAYGITVQVADPSEDDWGDDTPGTPRSISGCVFYPRFSSEAEDNRNTVIVGGVLLAPFGTQISPRSVVTLPEHPMVPPALWGTHWRVEGQPGGWASPFTGWKPGTEVALERVTG